MTMLHDPWPARFALRDAIARQAWRRHGAHIPLEEYLSQGNLVLAECAARGIQDLRHVQARLCLGMRRVPREECPHGNTRATHAGRRLSHRVRQTLPFPSDWAGWNRFLHPVRVPSDTTVFTQELLDDLARLTSPLAVQAFMAQAWGWHTRELPGLLGRSRATIQRRLAALVRVLPVARAHWQEVR